MKTLTIGIWLVVSYWLSAPHVIEDWKLVKSMENLSVYTRSTAKSKYKEVKIQGGIKCHMNEIVAALEDIEAQKVWVLNTEDVKLLSYRTSGNFSYYISTDMPFPIIDRELLVDHSRSTGEDGSIHIDLKNAVLDLPSDGHYIRIPYYKSHYTLKAVDAAWIKIEYRVILDPGGEIPAWLYNLAVTKGPISSFKALYDIIYSGRYRDASKESIVDNN